MNRESTTCLRLLWVACSFVIASPSIAGDQPPAPGSSEDAGAFVGSKSCSKCHSRIYRTWRASRHSYSILTGEEAREAGYPLPVDGGKGTGHSTPIHDWKDVSYVVGGRQRIAYADQSGQVRDTSYHHRTGRWAGFPAKQMKDCGPCHFTGVGAGEPHAKDAALPESWAELNIGCESCHGPGGNHVQDLFDSDMPIDISSRQCGTCHTARGRVLPLDDLHDTHDLVQTWNSDRHVTGVRLHSHNGFCARCHSPYQGIFNAPPEEASVTRVFTESKQTITCIACHDPHDLTNPQYSRSQVSLGPPRAAKFHIYQGNDRDFESSDFKELKSRDQVCVQCHRGADRIDLEHANAGCSDCHNTFHRNRGAASLVAHDANRPALSCRGCHRDADHLMAILFGDSAFLEPKRIHNLERLPREAIAKYGFRAASVTPPRTAALANAVGRAGESRTPYSADPKKSSSETAEAIQARCEAPPAESRATQPGARAKSRATQMLESAPHAELANHASVRKRRLALEEHPDDSNAILGLALTYVELRAFEPAKEILALALANDSPRLLTSASGKSIDEKKRMFEDLQSIEAGLQPLLERPDMRVYALWLEGYVAIADGRPGDAEGHFDRALELAPENANLFFYRGIAQILRADPSAIDSLNRAIAIRRDHRGALVVMGLTYLQLDKRLSHPQRMLEEAIAEGSGGAEIRTILGRIYLRRGMTQEASCAFRTAIALNPDYIGARYSLAKTHRLDEDFDAAMDVYASIIDRWPDDFESHHRAGSLLKYRADEAAFRLLGAREKAPHAGTTAWRWNRQLAELRQESIDYGQRAGEFFGKSLRLRPDHLDSARQLCELHRRFARLAQARDCFAKLVQQHPDEWLHHYRLGTVLVEYGAFDEATESLQKAQAMAPIVGDIYLALALAFIRDERIDEAIATLEQGRIFEPFNPALYTNLGAAYATRGQLENARRALERSIELSTFPLPRLHLTYTNLALVHWREGRDEEAKRALKNALYAYPSYAYAQRLLDEMQSQDRARALDTTRPFVFNGSLERFGLVTTVAFDSQR